MINSHLLYQLSYRGMRRMLLIKKRKSSIVRQLPEIQDSTRLNGVRRRALAVTFSQLAK